MEIFIALLVLGFIALFALMSLPLSQEDRQLIDLPDNHPTRPTH